MSPITGSAKAKSKSSTEQVELSNAAPATVPAKNAVTMKTEKNVKIITATEQEILTTVINVARTFRRSIKSDILNHKDDIIKLKDEVFEVVRGSKGKRVRVDGEFVYFKQFVTAHFDCKIQTLYNLLNYKPDTHCKKCGELKNSCKKQGPCAPPNHTLHPKYVDGYEHGVADERKKHELADDGLTLADLYHGNDGEAFITSLAKLVKDFCRRNEMCDRRCTSSHRA
jgi:hypothetical protein